MNKYEIMIIVKPDVDEEARNKVLDSFKEILTEGEGVIDNVTEMGMRDLAYEIQKYTKGYYVVIDTHTSAASIAEFDRLSRINTNFLRHLTLRRD